MKRVQILSGFPEWLPEQRMVEQALLDAVRQQFELFGFAPLDTRSVEFLETLVAKGETSKEIYALRRLHDDTHDTSTAKLGLHFDLTVPLARYVVERESELVFPFKRYQIQRVWRGERPQDGRFREFYQADIDILANEQLPSFFEVEIAEVLLQVFAQANMPAMRLHVSNRKIMDGVLHGFGYTNLGAVLMAIDKLAKIGERQVLELLMRDAQLTLEHAQMCLRVAGIQLSDAALLKDAVYQVVPNNEQLEAGLCELQTLLGDIRALGFDNIVADLGIVRGLDYYTGTVYEGYLVDAPRLGAVCSGGRYDNLTQQLGRSKALPGVGASVGITRMLSYLFAQNHFPLTHKTPTQVLICLDAQANHLQTRQLARYLRQKNMACEVFPAASKIAKQIQYAAKKGIPYVMFAPLGLDGKIEIRDINRGEQVEIDVHTWQVP